MHTKFIYKPSHAYGNSATSSDQDFHTGVLADISECCRMKSMDGNEFERKTVLRENQQIYESHSSKDCLRSRLSVPYTNLRSNFSENHKIPTEGIIGCKSVKAKHEIEQCIYKFSKNNAEPGILCKANPLYGLKNKISDYIFRTVTDLFFSTPFMNDYKYWFDKVILIFSQTSIVVGFMFFKEYATSFQKKFSRFECLVKVFCVCCILSEKVLKDSPRSNGFFAELFNIDIRLINYNEALVINTLNYNLEIDPKQYNKTVFEAIRNDYRWHNINNRSFFYASSGTITPNQ